MKICVFGSCAVNADEKFLKMGEKFGKALACHGHSMVYGGGKSGVLGMAAVGAKEEGASVIGVIPEGAKKSLDIFEGCSKYYEEKNMTDRKKKMDELSDAFVVLPGGMGTLDEFSDVCSRYLELEDSRKIILYNYQHYFDGLLSFLHRAQNYHMFDREWKEKVSVREDMQMIFTDLMN